VQGCGFDYAEGLYAENLNSDIYTDDTFSHNMEWVTDKGIEFIDQAVNASEPFFLYFNPTVPHASGNVLEALQNFTCQQTPEGDLDEEPSVPYMTKDVGCETYRQSVIDRAGDDTANYEIGSIWVDDSIGALLQHLEDVGELDNTFFLFQMDHGQEGKATLYEPGTRMATFVHYPNAFQAGSTFDGITSTIDIGPTILDFAGLDEEATGYYQMDGESWKDAVGDSNLEEDWKERCIVHELESDRAVLCGCDKYINIFASDSATATGGASAGAAVDSEILFRLCDEDGNYITSPDDSPEETAITDDELLSKLQEVRTCHLNRTHPAQDPDYNTECTRTYDDEETTCERSIFIFGCKD
jgi:arylsulfatase A-like enzyme